MIIGARASQSLKRKSDGDSLWMRRYSHFPTYDNEQNDLAFTSDNGLVLAGMTMGYPDWIESVWIQKLDSIGCDSVGCDTKVVCTGKFLIAR